MFAAEDDEELVLMDAKLRLNVPLHIHHWEHSPCIHLIVQNKTPVSLHQLRMIF
jgi:hypothetical protein